MIRLHNDKLDILRKYLHECRLSDELYEEILDHIACEAEERMWDGDTFENILNLIEEEAQKPVLFNLNADLKEILKSEESLTDIVFEGRNKQYGAYDLRKGYDSTIQRSVILGVTLFLFMIILPDLYARLTPELNRNDIGFELDLNNVNIRPLIERNVTPLINTSHSDNAIPDGIKDHLVAETDQFTNYNYHSKSNLPRDFDLPSDLFFNEQLLKLAEGKGIFDLIDQKPEFKGGMSELMHYIGFQIDYPANAVKNSIQGRVMIGFTIGNDGAVKDVDVIKGIGYGCDEEAKRVIANMPKWRPGRQGGESVSTRYLIPVVFEIKKL